jgi:hypothetical protein
LITKETTKLRKKYLFVKGLLGLDNEHHGRGDVDKCNDAIVDSLARSLSLSQI